MTPKLQALLDHCRAEKSELRRLEHQRVALALEPATAGRDRAIEQLDLRIGELRASRVKLLHDIAKETPGYPAALRYAVNNLGFIPAVGTARYNNRRDGCYTFGMPAGDVIAVWVDDGVVVRAESIDW